MTIEYPYEMVLERDIESLDHVMTLIDDLPTTVRTISIVRQAIIKEKQELEQRLEYEKKKDVKILLLFYVFILTNINHHDIMYLERR